MLLLTSQDSAAMALVSMLLRPHFLAAATGITGNVMAAAARRLCFLAAATVSAWAFLLPAVHAQQPSVHYIVSPHLGNFFTAAGKNLPDMDTYLTLSLNESTYISKCVCCLLFSGSLTLYAHPVMRSL